MFSLSIPPFLRRKSGLLAELAEARRRIAELEEKLEIDPLLNVFNRRGLERALRRTIGLTERYQAEAAALVIDIDNFKNINDWYGHVAGDRVLQAVSSLLVSKVRSSDVVARWGGDELVLLLLHTNELNALSKAAALEGAVASLRVPFSEHMLSVTVSVGVTVIRPEDTPIKAIKRADTNMLLRKKARKPAAEEAVGYTRRDEGPRLRAVSG
jgi:diguanylate cyclase (GGDEF)-like protein